ncbi:MAG: hypothetical protein JO257_32870 [Deltaproteobacteria bacterium]|nr:hypothetical protein [Deltaproteobacteria bacterium]
MRSLSLLVVAACGGSPGPRAPHAPDEPRLIPGVAQQTWYRATTICGQGPYEIELPATGSKYGEEVEVMVHAPHAVALHAELVADGTPVQQTTYGQTPANARCVADTKERLAAGHAGGGFGGGTQVQTGTMVVPPPAASTPPALSIETSNIVQYDELLKFRVPDGAAPHLTIRIWSVEPNDLEGVFFGAADVVWRPNVPEAQWEAHLRAAAERERAEAEAWAKAHPPQVVVVPQETAEERARRERDEQERIRREQERLRLQHERELEDARRRELQAALELQRREARAKYCAAHGEDRDCWGAGGLRVHLDLEAHQREADAYCAAHKEDARCWSAEDWSLRRTTWNKRLDAAAAASTCQPTGAPPAPQGETQPPALSEHATWRPGYWQWTECTWVWLAGQWRVPDSDIAANATTKAPAAPPPPQAETPTPPPVRTAVWIGGFWQWSGSTWVWIAGSWQLPPSPSVTWRPAEWQPRGVVHVLVPGGWIRVR